MQNYEHHVRWYKPHQLVFLPIMLILFVFSIVKCIMSFGTDNQIGLIWLILSLLIFVMAWFSMLVRGHYALTLQNRIVVNEVEFRYYRLTGKLMKELGYKFNDKQIFALRFAPDNELSDLVNQTVEGNLSPDDIKKRVKNWLADNRRV